jgi:hypothetical protein
MAHEVQVQFQLNMDITTRANITENQIRSYLVTYGPMTRAWFDNIVASAPPIAQASIVSQEWDLEISGAAGQWQISAQPYLIVSVADQITDKQVIGFFSGFHNDAKNKLRAIVASAPATAHIEVLRWHVHPVDSNGNDLDPLDEVGP